MKTETAKKNNKSRIALSESGTNSVHSWRQQLCNEFAGIKISESDLVNWAVQSIGDELSKRHLDDIKNKYFDEVQQLEWLLIQARAARDNHDQETLSKLVGSLKRPPKREKSLPEQAFSSPPMSDSGESSSNG
jgi:hypothetical protein